MYFYFVYTVNRLSKLFYKVVHLTMRSCAIITFKANMFMYICVKKYRYARPRKQTAATFVISRTMCNDTIISSSVSSTIVIIVSLYNLFIYEFYTWSHPPANKNAEESIFPILHAWPHKCLWLASVSVSDRGVRVQLPPIQSTVCFCSLGSWQQIAAAASRFEFMI